MPRHNRRSASAAEGDRPLRAVSQAREQWRGEEFLVRRISGSDAAKVYRCPGCDQEIRAGLAHVVAWPAYDAGAEDRRHWHTGCWAARERRAPGIQRGRSAPRY